ncbi:hypothetical protein MSS93_15970 [Deinococcus radiodurans]|nr:hypothetical protein MSS93_15970 [Deinococcus radiodurans]
MLRTLVLNFCLLVTLVYLLSLTYKSAADLADSRLQVPRFLLVSLMCVPLMFFPAQVAPGVFVDLRAVPIAFLTLRLGWGWGWWAPCRCSSTATCWAAWAGRRPW